MVDCFYTGTFTKHYRRAFMYYVYPMTMDWLIIQNALLDQDIKCQATGTLLQQENMHVGILEVPTEPSNGQVHVRPLEYSTDRTYRSDV